MKSILPIVLIIFPVNPPPLQTITHVEDVTPVWEQGGIMDGYYSYYSQRPTDAMKAIHAPDWEGPVIALVDCGRVGSAVWIDIGRGWEEARVMDCMGKDGDPAMWARERWMFELGFYTAVEVGSYGNGLQPGLMAFEAQDSGGKG
jgi:hypothetical protein